MHRIFHDFAAYRFETKFPRNSFAFSAGTSRCPLENFFTRMRIPSESTRKWKYSN